MVPAAHVVFLAHGVDLLHLAEQVAQIINIMQVQIKQAVEALYNVHVERVNTMNYEGKKQSRYTKSGVVEGRTSSYKKAIVTLREGETIDLFSNI